MMLLADTHTHRVTDRQTDRQNDRSHYSAGLGAVISLQGGHKSNTIGVIYSLIKLFYA